MANFKYDKDSNMYWTSNSINNKSCIIAFMESKGEKGINKVYNIAFAVASNRKQAMSWLTGKGKFIEDKITGSGDIKPLVWAKKTLLEFEEFIRNKKPSERIVIEIRGSDKRRLRVYKSVMTKFGYASSWTKLTKEI